MYIIKSRRQTQASEPSLVTHASAASYNEYFISALHPFYCTPISPLVVKSFYFGILVFGTVQL